MQSTWPTWRRHRHAPATVLRRGVALGILADLLLRGGIPGVGASLWILAFVAVAAVPVLRAGTESGRSVLEPAALAALGAAGLSWRASPYLSLLSVAVLGAAATLALLRAHHEAPGRTGLLGYVRGMAGGGWSVLKGAAPVLGRVDPSGEGGERLRSRGGVMVRGLLVAAPLLLVFSGLFASADPAFERALERGVDAVAGDLTGHLVLAALFGWASTGALWALRGLGRPCPLPAKRIPGVGAGEVVVALVLVNLLFGGFIGFQAGYLFGGRELVDATEGLGYATYARRGFFELVAAAALVLPVLLASEWTVREDGGGAARWARRLARLLVGLVAILLVSAAHRMILYQEAYGLTDLRFYTSAFMVWLAVTFAWAGRTLLRGRPERFPGGAVRTGALLAALLLLLDPSGIIARTNVARADRAGDGGLDVPHLLALGADPVPELVAAVGEVEGEARCELARGLVDRWGEPEEGDWRTWNVARWQARRAVEGARTELEAAAAGC